MRSGESRRYSSDSAASLSSTILVMGLTVPGSSPASARLRRASRSMHTNASEPSSGTRSVSRSSLEVVSDEPRPPPVLSTSRCPAEHVPRQSAARAWRSPIDRRVDAHSGDDHGRVESPYRCHRSGRPLSVAWRRSHCRGQGQLTSAAVPRRWAVRLPIAGSPSLRGTPETSACFPRFPQSALPSERSPCP